VLLVCVVAFGQEVVAPIVEGQPVWVVLLVALIPAIIAILERMGKKKAVANLKGAITVGRTVFAAVEDAKATDVKKMVAEVMADDAISPAAKEINKMIHSITDVETAKEAPPIKRFFRRMLSGENMAGVLARIAGRAAITDLIEDR